MDVITTDPDALEYNAFITFDVSHGFKVRPSFFVGDAEKSPDERPENSLKDVGCVDGSITMKYTSQTRSAFTCVLQRC